MSHSAFWRSLRRPVSWSGCRVTRVRLLAPKVLIRGVLHMAAVCEICGKGPGFGKSVSHSHRRTSRRWDPNIQTVRAVAHAGGNKKRINVCTSCIKAGKVSRG